MTAQSRILRSFRHLEGNDLVRVHHLNVVVKELARELDEVRAELTELRKAAGRVKSKR